MSALDQGFYAVELDMFAPGSAGNTTLDAWGVAPTGMLNQAPGASDSSETLRASDAGYRTRSTDPAGVQVYPPTMLAAFAIDRRLNLDPAKPAAAAAWGAISLANGTRRYDGLVASRNSDGRAIRVYAGTKTWDAARGYLTDPAYAGLSLLFSGISAPWMLNEASLDIPLRDATYWIERPLQQTVYGGTGGYDGTAQMAGMPKPKARGGTASYPILNVTPVQIDPVNRIYQYSDGPGTVVTLYEGGAPVFTYAGDTTNLYAGSTPAGQYRTDNSRGLFQLGSTPVRQITCDVTGAFPVAGAKSSLFDIARYVLSEDLALPSGNLDVASFTAAAAAYPYIAGIYWGPVVTDGAAAIGQLMASAAAALVPLRSGLLSALVLRAPPPTASTALTAAQIVSMTPRDLPAPLAPPPYRWRIGYAANNTVQTSDLNGAVTDARRQFLGQANSIAAASSSAIIAQYRRPSDPPILPTALQVAAEASSVAASLVALWSTRRRLYDVVLPLSVALTLELGSAVQLSYPLDDLASGRVGLIVGEQFRSADQQITFQVLV